MSNLRSDKSTMPKPKISILGVFLDRAIQRPPAIARTNKSSRQSKDFLPLACCVNSKCRVIRCASICAINSFAFMSSGILNLLLDGITISTAPNVGNQRREPQARVRWIELLGVFIFQFKNLSYPIFSVFDYKSFIVAIDSYYFQSIWYKSYCQN